MGREQKVKRKCSRLLLEEGKMDYRKENATEKPCYGTCRCKEWEHEGFFKALSTSEKWRHPANDTQLKYGEMTGSLHA